jgi:hypothetical protein
LARIRKSLAETSKTDCHGRAIAFRWRAMCLPSAQRKPGESEVDQAGSVQDWINSLNPMVAFLLMGGLFLFAGTGGWYVANAASALFGRDEQTRRRP